MMNTILYCILMTTLSLMLLSGTIAETSSLRGDNNLDIDETRTLSSRGRKLQSMIGDFNALVILARFKDHKNRNLPTRSYFDNLFNNPDIDETIDPAGVSVKRFFKENSNGKFNVKSTVYGWVDLPKDLDHYDSQSRTILINDAMSALVDEYDDIDLSIYDNGDFDDDYAEKNIRSVIVMTSGTEDELGGRFSFRTSTAWEHDSGYQVDGGATMGAVNPKDTTNVRRLNTIAHEIGHVFGLIDYYDTDSSSNGLGYYEVMSITYRVDGFQQIFSCYTKAKLGWLTPTEINDEGTFTIDSISTNFQNNNDKICYKIKKGFPEGEYLLIENRQSSGSYDSLVSTGGLAIYHVDDTVVGDDGDYESNEEGYPGQNGWPTNGKHLALALLQADGLYDLEKDVNHGNPEDLFHGGVNGRDHLLTSSDYTEEGVDVYPNTDAYQDGDVYSSEVRISEISESGETMTFKVAFQPLSATTTTTPTTTTTTTTPTSSKKKRKKGKKKKKKKKKKEKGTSSGGTSLG